MRLRLVPALLLIAAAAATSATHLRGQTPLATRVIDFTATDPGGAPVTTVQAADVMLRIDGRVHPVQDLRLVRVSTGESVLSAPYASNQAPAGRDISVAVDVTRFEPTDLPRVRETISTLIGVLGPHDRVSVTALADDGFTTDYTSRPELVRAIATKLPATAQPMQDTEALEAAAVKSLSLLELRSNILGTDPGHKTLIYVAPSFGASSPIRKGIQAVAAITARQRIQLMVVDPRAVATPSPGHAALAAATGAIILPPTADALRSAVGPSSARYELQFALTEEDDQDDKLHRVQLVSLRKDVQLLAPTQIFFARSGAAAEPMTALTDMLRQPRAWRDLPLRLAVFPTLDVERDRLRLLVLGEPEPPMRPLAWARFALIAPSNAIVAEWTAEGSDLTARPIMTAVLAPPGPYRLRMVASELAGLRGSVDYEFDVRLTPAGSLNLGPMMFGGISNQAFLPVLQMPADAAAVMAYVEIYGRLTETDKVTASFEVATTADGPSIATIDGSIRTTPEDDRRAALGTIDLAPLKPGDYTVRGIVSLNGSEVGRVTRTLRKAAQ